MGITSSTKTLSVSQISCNESFKVTLALSALSSVVNHPKDIVLLLDRSGSMSGQPSLNMKKGVNTFIDVIDDATDQKKDGIIGNGNRISIVSFSTRAEIDQPLTNSVSALKQAVQSLQFTGSTNHKAAFEKALSALSAPTTNEQIIILFTDGESNPGSEGFEIAQEAKAKGITIYCLGYGDDKRLNISALNTWATSPSSAYALITPNVSEIEQTFTNLVSNIAKPGATNIIITDTISDCFKVISVDTPSKGSCEMLNHHSIQWKIDQLGNDNPEGAFCTFTVQHQGNCSGDLEVNKSLDYTDAQYNQVFFPSPKINVVCNKPIVYEKCPEATKIAIPTCSDSIEYNAGDLSMNSLGHILQLSVTLKNVCPNRRVALGVLLYETDSNDNEYSRGMKTMLIPAQSGTSCKDIYVRCIKFVLPEDLDLTGNPSMLCNPRHFKARLLANYIDTDFTCCENTKGCTIK